ncbi:hypothetical protein IP360_05040 [Helicobacter winghamensis]|uniref:hypothetical protein n=1 Tax=Helicobacter winghamensis TaxID=157268 RepID=UPI0027A8E255
MKIFYFALLVLWFGGCASKPMVKVEIQEVFVPIKCNVEIPQRPKRQGMLVENIRAIALYAEKLEIALKECVKGE